MFSGLRKHFPRVSSAILESVCSAQQWDLLRVMPELEKATGEAHGSYAYVELFQKERKQQSFDAEKTAEGKPSGTQKKVRMQLVLLMCVTVLTSKCVCGWL